MMLTTHPMRISGTYHTILFSSSHMPLRWAYWCEPCTTVRSCRVWTDLSAPRGPCPGHGSKASRFQRPLTSPRRIWFPRRALSKPGNLWSSTSWTSWRICSVVRPECRRTLMLAWRPSTQSSYSYLDCLRTWIRSQRGSCGPWSPEECCRCVDPWFEGCSKVESTRPSTLKSSVSLPDICECSASWRHLGRWPFQ